MDENPRRRQTKLRGRHLKLPSRRSSNCTEGPQLHRSFLFRGLLRSPGCSRRQDFPTESRRCRPFPPCSCRSLINLCHCKVIKYGLQTNLSTGHSSAFKSNVIDFDSEPSCWTGTSFGYVRYTIPRVELDDIAADFGFWPHKQLSAIVCRRRFGLSPGDKEHSALDTTFIAAA
jgi:hypothetical protein